MSILNKHKSLIKTLLLTPLLFFAITGIAKSESFSINPDSGRLNLGFAFKNQAVLPAPQSIGESPLPDLWQARDTQTLPGQPGVDPSSFKPVGCLSPVTFTVTWAGAPGTPVPNDGQSGRPGPTPNDSYPCGLNPTGGEVNGEVDYRGNVTVPANDFRFPVMVVPSPIDGSPVPITLAATGELTGRYNNETGGLSLSGPIEARVLVGLSTNPLGQYCSVPLPGLTLSSATSTPESVGFAGNNFAEGLDSEGSLTGTWTISEDATPVGDADCSRVNSVIFGLGGLWLGVGINSPDPYPECQAGTVGSWPDCAPAPVAAISLLSGKFANEVVKAGKSTSFVIKVKNNGQAPGTKSLRVYGNTRKISYVKSVSVSLQAGETKTVRVKVRAKRNVWGGARLWVGLGGRNKTSAVYIQR